MILRNGVGKECHEKLSVTCSLVHDLEIEKNRIPGLKIIGNLLVLPEFGTVALGEVEVGLEFAGELEPYEDKTKNEDGPRMSNYFQLKMLDMQLGCVGSGRVAAGTSKTNGNTKP